MYIRFWGVRGSYPTPMTPEKLKGKISAVVQRIKPEDLKSSETRELFLSKLPEWLFGTPGGNTPCIECSLADDSKIILDAGTGIAEYGLSMAREGLFIPRFDIFFTHFHYDHIQGLPFLGQAYNPKVDLHFYSPLADLEYILKDHMAHPYFPVTMQDKMSPKQQYHVLKPQESVQIGTAEVSWYKLNHPGKAFAYKIRENDKTFVYASDVELSEQDFPEYNKDDFFEGVDVLVMDTMYTLGEAIDKYNWGHSSFSLGVEFAIKWKVKTLVLFHHEPKYEDRQLYINLHTAQWYAQKQKSELKVILAEEGLKIEI